MISSLIIFSLERFNENIETSKPLFISSIISFKIKVLCNLGKICSMNAILIFYLHKSIKFKT